MLDGSKIEDIEEISKYGKAKGFLLAKRYGLPTFSNFYIIESEREAKELLSKFSTQQDFCMRSDTRIGNNPVGVGGRNGNRDTILDYMREIEEKSEEAKTKGVGVIYWNEGKFCSTYECEGAFYLDYRTKENLNIDYIGKGWDGSFLSHGSACHEVYTIPWEEILFFTEKNRIKYRQKVVGEQEYEQLREERIIELNTKYNLPLKQCEEEVPLKYSGIKPEYFRQVIEQVIIPMYDAPELQRYYKEYIPIAQIENEKVLVPEVILPTRLKYRKPGEDYGER